MLNTARVTRYLSIIRSDPTKVDDSLLTPIEDAISALRDIGVRATLERSESLVLLVLSPLYRPKWRKQAIYFMPTLTKTGVFWQARCEISGLQALLRTAEETDRFLELVLRSQLFREQVADLAEQSKLPVDSAVLTASVAETCTETLSIVTVSAEDQRRLGAWLDARPTGVARLDLRDWKREHQVPMKLDSAGLKFTISDYQLCGPEGCPRIGLIPEEG